jgi:hypothetical protein
MSETKTLDKLRPGGLRIENWEKTMHRFSRGCGERRGNLNNLRIVREADRKGGWLLGPFPLDEMLNHLDLDPLWLMEDILIPDLDLGHMSPDCFVEAAERAAERVRRYLVHERGYDEPRLALEALEHLIAFVDTMFEESAFIYTSYELFLRSNWSSDLVPDSEDTTGEVPLLEREEITGSFH